MKSSHTRTIEMEETRSRKSCHILVIPFSIQGHINPMLQFAKRLASRNLKVTLLLTKEISEFVRARVPESIDVAQVSDGTDVRGGNPPANLDAFFERFETEFPKNLLKFVESLSCSGSPVSVIVFDSFMPCVLGAAKKLGVKVASFFTQSVAVGAIYVHMQQGTLKLPLEDSEEEVTLPSLPVMSANELPSFIYDVGSYPPLLKIAGDHVTIFGESDWLLFNSFEKLENEAVKWMASQWPIMTVGPAIPSIYLDKRLENDKEYGISLFEPQGESCINWLDTKETLSVVYVSFGSISGLREEQMEELAMGFMESNHCILWVVRDSETSKLPNEFVTSTCTKERILIVNWCSQLEVLSHRAVGCFMSHCGWNSTLEALSLGVPVVAFPQWTDQTTNAKYIVDVWGAGVRAKVDEKGIARRAEVDLCIRKVMEEESGREIRRNVGMWKELAKEATDQGGSSDNNIEDFISKIIARVFETL